MTRMTHEQIGETPPTMPAAPSKPQVTRLLVADIAASLGIKPDTWPKTRVHKIRGRWFVECNCGLIFTRSTWREAYDRLLEHSEMGHGPHR